MKNKPAKISTLIPSVLKGRILDRRYSFPGATAAFTGIHPVVLEMGPQAGGDAWLGGPLQTRRSEAEGRRGDIQQEFLNGLRKVDKMLAKHPVVVKSGRDGDSLVTMTPRLRKFALTAHITFSVGWLGAVVAYLALAIAGLTSHDVSMVRAAYISMELIGWFVIVPFSIAALLTGLVQSVGTQWGLFRHYWILVKFLLTTGATIVSLRHIQAVSRMSGVAAETTLSSADFRALRIQRQSKQG